MINKYRTFHLKAITVENDEPLSDVPCHQINCTACCEKLSPFLTEEEFKSGKYIYTFLNHIDPSTPAIAIPRTSSSCIYLDHNKRCTIYEDRPQACRQFDCRKGHGGQTVINMFI
jgi:Fe-S-cluster containining protein